MKSASAEILFKRTNFAWAVLACWTIAGVPLSGAAPPALGIVEVDLKSEVFPDENPGVLQHFSTSNSLTGDANYKKLFKECKGYENPATCKTLDPVFGVVSRTDVNTSTRAMNRMLILQPNGARIIRDVEVSDGKLKYDRSLVKANQMGIINLTYFRADASGGDKSPFLRCEAEVIVCSPEMGACPQAEPARCIPTASTTSTHTTTTSSCKCDGPNEGKVLEKCVQNVPTCVPPKGCATGEVRLPDGVCAKIHSCDRYAADTATHCVGKSVNIAAPAGGPWLPENLVCEGTLNDASCAPPAACAMQIVLAPLVHPTTTGGTDGVMSASATGATGAVTYTLTPAPATPGVGGTFTGLSAQDYILTATDSATPVPCSKPMTVTLTDMGRAPSCSMAPQCTDAALTSLYCPGLPFKDGCGNACANQGTKTEGCTTAPPPPAGKKCPATLVAGNASGNPTSGNITWFLTAGYATTGGSGIAVAYIPETDPGKSVTFELDGGSMGNVISNNYKQPVQVFCESEGNWNMNVGAASLRVATASGRAIGGSPAFGFPPVYAHELYSGGSACYADAGQPMIGMGTIIGSEMFYASTGYKKYMTWQKMSAGTACPTNGETTAGLSVGQPCPKSNGSGIGTMEGFSTKGYIAVGTEPYTSTTRPGCARGVSWVADGAPSALCSCK